MREGFSLEFRVNARLGRQHMMKLRVAERDDLEIIYSMQKEAFAPLYEKYQDTETSPATEPFEKTIQRINNINVTYYLIVVIQVNLSLMEIINIRRLSDIRT